MFILVFTVLLRFYPKNNLTIFNQIERELCMNRTRIECKLNIFKANRMGIKRELNGSNSGIKDGLYTIIQKFSYEIIKTYRT